MAIPTRTPEGLADGFAPRSWETGAVRLGSGRRPLVALRDAGENEEGQFRTQGAPGPARAHSLRRSGEEGAEPTCGPMSLVSFSQLSDDLDCMTGISVVTTNVHTEGVTAEVLNPALTTKCTRMSATRRGSI